MYGHAQDMIYKENVPNERKAWIWMNKKLGLHLAVKQSKLKMLLFITNFLKFFE